jgi:hypothetical protein
MVLLGDEAQMDVCFRLFGDSANLDARYVRGLRRAAQKSFWTHLMELLGDVDHVDSCFGPFGDC